MLAAQVDVVVAQLDLMSLAPNRRLGREVAERARVKEAWAELESRMSHFDL